MKIFQQKYLPCSNSSQEFIPKSAKDLWISTSVQGAEGRLHVWSVYTYCLGSIIRLDNKRHEKFAKNLYFKHRVKYLKISWWMNHAYTFRPKVQVDIGIFVGASFVNFIVNTSHVITVQCNKSIFSLAIIL